MVILVIHKIFIYLFIFSFIYLFIYLLFIYYLFVFLTANKNRFWCWIDTQNIYYTRYSHRPQYAE